jgi:hypothetical protein
MKYLLGFLLSFVLGIATAGAAFFFNPLTDEAGQPATAGATTLSYSLSDRHLLAQTHNRMPGLAAVPADIPLLWESAVDKSVLQLLALESDSGDIIGVASKVSVPSPQSNFVTKGLVVDERWLVTLPGRGSFFIDARSNLWPLVKDTLIRSDLLKQGWSGPQSYDSIVGPAGSAGRITGLSGDFVDAAGTARETLRIDDYRLAGFGGLSGELKVEFEAGAR